MPEIRLAPGLDTERPRGRFVTEDGGDYSKMQLEFVSDLIGFLNREGVPRTFFLLGLYLEGLKESSIDAEARQIYSQENGLTEIGSHGYLHRAFKILKGREDKKIITPEEFIAGLGRTNRLLQEILGVAPKGMRTPFGYADGLSGMTEILKALEESGFCYASSNLCVRGPLDAPLTSERQPHTYAQDGYPNIPEIHVHGPHDTVFSDEKWKKYFANRPEHAEIVGYYTGLIDTTEEMEEDRVYICLSMHPWSMMDYDPKLETLGRIIDYAREKGAEFASYGSIAEEVLSREAV